MLKNLIKKFKPTKNPSKKTNILSDITVVVDGKTQKL